MYRNLRLTRFAGRGCSTSITIESLCAAVDAIPGMRLGAFSTGETLLGVEVYDAVLEAWRIVVTLDRGEAWVERSDLEDRRSSIFHAVERLASLLDACLVTEDGAVLIWGEDLVAAA
jgi:hypothetical protein